MEIKFFADRMLGKLAKKLRFLGYDTFYKNEISEDAILQICKNSGRILLTRDKSLLEKAVKNALKVCFLSSDSWRQQLSELARRLHLTYNRKFTRCSLCNAVLEHASLAEVAKKVPIYVQQMTDEFYVCPVCGRIYWSGTHVEHILIELKGLMDAWKQDP